ncbi:MAG: ABC transporter ATP-binding protein, partial [Oscillospiraceae bacterium]
GLDPKERVRLRETLAALAKDRIILVATHVVSDVESVAREIILLKDGQIVDKASPAALVEQYVPSDANGGVSGNLEDVYLAIFGRDDA